MSLASIREKNKCKYNYNYKNKNEKLFVNDKIENSEMAKEDIDFVKNEIFRKVVEPLNLERLKT